MSHDIIPVHLAVKSMRDSGYKDAAHAIAELVDNSAQATAKNIEVLCIDEIEYTGRQRRGRIKTIATYDNGHGMDPDTLRMALQFGNGTHLEQATQDGMGKFGMGLPNSSLSQCRYFQVWSWQEGTCYYTYLDVKEIEDGKLTEVPKPVKKKIPAYIKKLIKTPIKESGTLVVWSKLDRVRWKTSKAFLSNAENLIGRMYRYFIEAEKINIRLASYEKDGESFSIKFDDYAKANDPLYLMKKTNLETLPSPFEHESFFEEYGREQLDVTIEDGSTHRINIIFSLAKPKVRAKLCEFYNVPHPGKAPQGKHASKNIGVSVIRAGREIELNATFTIGYDTTERWWGVEVSFPPALDKIFGVTNNKQAATSFYQMDIEIDAEYEGMSAQEYKEILRAEDDPRQFMYELSNIIDSNLSEIRRQVKRVREGTRKKTDSKIDPAEKAASIATEIRKEEGFFGESDKDEELTKEERKEAIAQLMEDTGLEHDDAREIAVRHVESGLKYIFQDSEYDGPSFFSTSRRGGAIFVNINTRHPITKYLYELLEENEKCADSLLALKLILSAWARLEDEARSEQLRERLSDMRNDWGRIAREFIRAAKETN